MSEPKTYRVTSLVPTDGIEHEFTPEEHGRGPFRFTIHGEIGDAVIVRYDEEMLAQMPHEEGSRWLMRARECVQKATGNDNILILGNCIDLVRLVEEPDV